MYKCRSSSESECPRSFVIGERVEEDETMADKRNPLGRIGGPLPHSVIDSAAPLSEANRLASNRSNVDVSVSVESLLQLSQPPFNDI